jgi:CRISPR-associated exonuclease Cas4
LKQEEIIENEPVMISALQHYSYCPRQCALIHVEQVYSENVHTLRGLAVHERVDDPDSVRIGTVRVEYSLPIYSYKLGLTGKADVVEFDKNDTPYPVEYKHGPKRAKEHDDVQLAAQVLCLEEMLGKSIPLGAIYHHSSRRRREVVITDKLKLKVEELVQQIRQMIQHGNVPAPVNDARCQECSLITICQPSALTAYNKIHTLRKELFEP